MTTKSHGPFSYMGSHGVYISIAEDVYLCPWMVRLPPKLRLSLLGMVSNPPNSTRLVQSILASVSMTTPTGVPEAALLECAQAYLAYLRGSRSPMDDSPEVIAQPQQWLAPVTDNPQDPTSRLWVGADLASRPFPN